MSIFHRSRRMLVAGLVLAAIAPTTACAPRYAREVEDAPVRSEVRYPDLPVAYAAMTREFLGKVRVKPGTVVCPALEGVANAQLPLEAAIVGELTRAGLKVLRLARQDAPFPPGAIFTEAELAAQGKVKQLAQQGVERLLMIAPMPGEPDEPARPRAYFRWVETASGLTEIVEVMNAEGTRSVTVRSRVGVKPEAGARTPVAASQPGSDAINGWKVGGTGFGLLTAAVGLGLGIYGSSPGWYKPSGGYEPNWPQVAYISWFAIGAGGLLLGALASWWPYDEQRPTSATGASASVTP